MGVTIIAETPPAASAYDNWKLYRATTETGTYSAINGATGQAITDMSYYDTTGTSSMWYKISYYDTDTSSESALSDPIKVLATEYTSVKKVESFLQLGTTITDSSHPNIQEVAEIIQRMEDRIDNRTDHAWRERFNGTKSAKATSAEYEYYDTQNWYKYQTGIPIYLSHRKIKDLDADKGDVLEYFNGSTWEDYITSKTEGRNNDYWFDYNQGIIYIKSRYLVRKPMSIRIKFRYGEKYVPGDIEDTCTKMTAIEFLRAMDPRSFPVQEGSPLMNHSERITGWEKDIGLVLHNFKEIGLMPNNL